MNDNCEFGKKFLSIMENATSGLFVHDFNGNIIEVNKYACELLGYSREEMLNMNVKDIEQDVELKHLQKEVWSKLKPNEPLILFGHHRRKNGMIFPVEIQVTRDNFQGQKVYIGLVKDITEHMKIKSSLQESEIKYKSLFELNPNYTSLLDPEWKIIDMNIASLQSIGYNLDDVTGKLFSELGVFIPEDIETYKETIDQLSEDRNIKPFSSRYIDKNGEIRWCQTHIIPIRKEEKLLGYQVISNDVTGEKIAETKLQESEKRLFDIIDFLPDPTFAIDNKGKVIAWNRAIEDMTGFNSDKMIGKGNYEYSLPFYGIRRPTLIDLVITPDENIEKNGYSLVKRVGETIMAETRAPLKGVNRTLWGKSVPFYDNKGNVNGAIEVIRDITERKKAEKDLFNSEEKFREVFNKSNDAITLTLFNTDGTLGQYIEVNDVMCQETGYTREELLKMNPMDIVSPKSFKEISKNAANLLKKGKATFETVHVSKDGHERPVEISAYVLTLKGQKVSISTIHDLTERKKAEKEINTTLHEKDILIREIHHRVKNNMQIISSLLNLQTQHVEEYEAHDVLKESQNRIKSMAMIHEKLYQSPDFNHINISDYIQSIITDLFTSYAIQNDQIKLVIEVEDINLNMETAIPCGLIISELVSNSLKYAFPNNKKGELHITLKSKGDIFHLTISDNGTGLPDDLDITHTETLGLQLVNSLTDQIDGKIEVDKTHGTKYNITFKELTYKKRI